MLHEAVIYHRKLHEEIRSDCDGKSTQQRIVITIFIKILISAVILTATKIWLFSNETYIPHHSMLVTSFAGQRKRGKDLSHFEHE